MKSNGTTDIVAGVTCDIRPFVDLAKECISYSQVGYDKDDYMKGLNMILFNLYQDNASGLELLNDDGHVVFSFEETPEIYTIYNEEEVAIGFIGVRQIEANLYGKVLPENPYENYNRKDSNSQSGTVIDYDASEDGLTSSSDPDDQIITNSIDDLPMSEIASLVEPVPDAYNETRTVVKACNTCYKFLKEYLNWKV